MGVTVAAGTDGRKHTFDSVLDAERTFEHDRPMQRTYVRRRRTLAAAVLLAAVLLVGSPVARAFGGADRGDTGSATHVVVAGDTLWSIAEGYAPGEDPRVVVHAISELNELDPGPLLPGRTLTLPPVG
jgi:nucleoid-associated protein YgaU